MFDLEAEAAVVAMRGYRSMSEARNVKKNVKNEKNEK